MSDRQWQGTWIPKEIWDHPELSWMEKCLLGEISNLDNGDGCYASREFLAERMKTSESSVANTISKLRKMGLIVNLKWDGRRQSITTVWQYALKVRQPSPPSEGSSHSQVKADQTIKNTDKYLIEKKTSALLSGKGLPPTLENTTSPPQGSDFESFLEKKATNKVKRELKKKYGGTIPSWVNVEKEVDKEVAKPGVRVSITPQYKEFCSFISSDRKAFHIPTMEGQRLWDILIAEGYHPSQIKCAARIAYRVDDYWKNNFTPELFFRKRSLTTGDAMDHVGKFVNYRAANNPEIVAIKQEMKAELETT